MNRVEEVQAVTNEAQIPLANILVAAIHRPVRRADAFLAAVDLVDKAFAITAEHDNIVPERQQFRRQTRASMQDMPQVLDLRALARTVESGKRNQQRLSVSGRRSILKHSKSPA